MDLVVHALPGFKYGSPFTSLRCQSQSSYQCSSRSCLNKFIASKASDRIMCSSSVSSNIRKSHKSFLSGSGGGFPDTVTSVAPKSVSSRVSAMAAVFDQKYVADRETVLIMKEPKIAWNTEYNILDTKGNTLFRLAKKKFSLHEANVLYDASDKVVLSTWNKIITVHNTIFVCPGEDDNDYILKAKKALASVTPHIYVYLKGTDSDPDFIIKGSFFEREFTMETSNGKVIGEMSKKFSLLNLFSEKDTFYLKVPAGVDKALVVALAVVIDEIYLDATEESKQ